MLVTLICITGISLSSTGTSHVLTIPMSTAQEIRSQQLEDIPQLARLDIRLCSKRFGHTDLAYFGGVL